MQRFFVVIICCLLVACCLCDENGDVNERAGGQQKQLPGGLTEQNPNDPLYKQLAEESLLKYLLQAGNYRHHSVLQVTRVTTQVVAGWLTRVNFIAAPTNCLLTGNVTPANSLCKVGSLDYSDMLSCYSEILEQPWLNKKEINVSCARVN